MLENVFINCQSSIRIVKDKVVYFDPFKIDKDYHDADFIFITHDHYDHYDIKSINRVKKDDTFLFIPATLEEEVSKYFTINQYMVVEPNKEYRVNGIIFNTVNAYNLNKDFHPKDNNWLGYVVTIGGVKYYAMGDTDDIPESHDVMCDVLFIPIGGTYTMNKEEALNCANTIKPKECVPIHYGAVVGTERDALYFINNLDKDIKGTILIETTEDL